MKKTIFTAAILAVLSLPAQAQEFEFKPYVGFDLQRSLYSYNKNADLGGGVTLNADSLFEDSLNGINVHAGARFHKHFGAEIGYFSTRNESKNIAATDIVGTIGGAPVAAGAPGRSKVRVQGLTLDGLGYLPLGDQERFELIGTAGISWSRAKANFNTPGVGSTSDKASEIGFRAGAGAQFNVTDKMNLRGLVRYQTADFDDIADRAWIYSMGLNYGF